MDCDKIKISLLDKSSIEEQYSVFVQAFSESLESNHGIDKWYLKHYQNPLGDSLVFGAWMNNRLVAIKAYYPAEYIYLGNTFHLLVSCDSAVIKECQGYGVWKLLVQYAINHIRIHTTYKYIISFPNPNSTYKGFTKLGWSNVSNLKNFIFINNTLKFTSLFTQSTSIQKLSTILNIQKLGVKFWENRNKQLIVKTCSANELIWKYDDKTAHLNLNSNILKWKFSLQDLNAIAIYDKDNVIATCIYSVRPYGNCKIIKIYHVTLNAEIEPKILYAKFIMYLCKKHNECAFIRVWEKQTFQKDDIYKSLLFLPTSHVNPFMIYSIDNNKFHAFWELSMLDLDY